MEEVKAPRPVGMPVWAIKFLAAVVTANVLIVILSHWTGYDWIGKGTAVVLLGLLVVIPAHATWTRKERRQYDWANLLPMYMVLMLTTVLFGLRA
jgi:hypothetical protein